ncbi:hypothetical protein [Rivularia sp. UHCC 0363]|uniref:hypothetical protein n=1 Tax=Rivularia sp. UHCC 0363 TaxID=3110244 RepID=UPI002B20D795|nr:hypothetical protein [Rivularia sp. UHCC 0363]MEA5597830.1 hypothetical protein [Rivularia sp. UHCC 0363]
MNNEEKQALPEDPALAEPGKGAPGNNHSAVQMAQTTAVNPPDAIIPSNAPTEESKREVEALEKQEEGTLHTTDGYIIDESGKLDNFAVEPKMYVEEK